DNTVSASTPGIGQHDFVFHLTGLTGTMSFLLTNASNVTRNSDGTYGFCDVDGDRKADQGGQTVIVAVNGQATSGGVNAVANVPIPSGGVITITIDTGVPNQRPRVVGWQDRNGDGVINLAGAGDTNCSAYTSYDASTDGAIIVSGRKYYFNREADPGVQFSGACMPMYRHDPQNQAFSAGVTSLASLKFLYDSGDTFKVLGTPVTLDQFKSSVTAFADGSGDTIAITYAPGGSSDFNICRNAGALAPTDLAATVGNFDTGSAADDVNLTFTAPLANQVNTYTVERSPLGSTTSASATNCNLNAAAGSTSDATGAPTGSSF